MIVNSTMVDDTANGPSQGSYISSTSSVLFNNIIIGLGGAALMMKTANAYTHDFNIISGWYSGSGYNTTNNTNEVTASSLEDGDGTSYMYDIHADGKAAGVNTGMSYYYWNGTTSTFPQTTKSAVANAIRTTSSFYTWLDELVDGAGTALDYDIRGEVRSSGYWPGSYQAN